MQVINYHGNTQVNADIISKTTGKCSGMRRSVVSYTDIDVSEEPASSIFRVEVKMEAACSSEMLVRNNVHGVTSQSIVIATVTAVRTSYLIRHRILSSSSEFTLKPSDLFQFRNNF
jgi:hypothetical protein